MKPSVPCSQPKATYSLRGKKNSLFSIHLPEAKKQNSNPTQTSKSIFDSSSPQAGGPQSNISRAHGNTTSPFVVSPRERDSCSTNAACGPPPGNASMITQKRS